MSTVQNIIDIDVSDLVNKVKDQKQLGARLVQICCTKMPEHLELHYSFDKDYQFTSYRITLTNTDRPVPSVSGIYFNSFIYENELHDLFGIKIEGIAVDYKGSFYKTKIATPFNQQQPAGGTQS